MKSFHVRRNFLKLAKRIGLIGFSAFGAGTVVNLGTAQSAQSKQISDSEQMQELLDRLTNLEQKLAQRPFVIEQVKPNVIEQAVDLFSVGNPKIPGLFSVYGAPTKSERQRPIIQLDGKSGFILVGGNGVNGYLSLYTADTYASPTNKLPDGTPTKSPTINISALNSTISLNKTSGRRTIQLDGNAGDILLENADCAEEFDVAEVTEEVEPGTVMVIDRDGKICQSEDAYDKCVAGVISGAGDYKPGIILDRKQSETKRLPIALVGKVYCKVDATYGAIQIGDLLTTSPTPGHAMKVDDPLKGFGAVLGKALRSLEAGQGLIPVLVALQ